MLYDVLNETSSNVTSMFVTTEESIITTTRSIFDTSDVELPEERDEYLAKIEVATLASILLITLLGNGTVLLALWIRRRYGGRKKLSRMYFFILHLSCADLITAFFSVLPQLAWDITYRFYGGSLLCKLIKFGQTLGPYLSSYVLMATAIDRHQAICYPLTYCSWTSRRSKLMVWFAWISSLTFCIPQVSTTTTRNKEQQSETNDDARLINYSVIVTVARLLVSRSRRERVRLLGDVHETVGRPCVRHMVILFSIRLNSSKNASWNCPSFHHPFSHTFYNPLIVSL